MKVRDLIHAEDPYWEFDWEQFPTDLQGWGGHRDVFEQLVLEARPKDGQMLIVEVGTWKGRSTILGFADSLTAHGIDAEIVCVDTWLGATEFWENHEDRNRYVSLGLKNGYPSVYYQFLANVCGTGYEDLITPFPQTSTNAARFFARKGLRPDLVYIDASHDYEDVKADLIAWAPLVREEGIIFGDDYCDHWSGVVQAVDETFFSPDEGPAIEHMVRQNGPGRPPSDYWIFRTGPAGRGV